jgi:CheY-like chemotaxis protein
MAHLLLVDDDTHLGQIVGILCRRGGHQLTHVQDNTEAWETLQRARPRIDGEGSEGTGDTGKSKSHTIDLILLDVNLPGESGIALCRRIRAEPALARLPVALFTHPDLVEDIAAGWEAGADFVVPKDLVTRHADWQQRLQEILSGSVGQPGFCLLPWTEGVPPSDECESAPSDRGETGGILGSGILSLPEWFDAVNEMLDHPTSHLSGVRVVEAVIKRAVHQVRQTDQSATWLTLCQGRVAASNPPPTSLCRDALRELILSLAEQLWHLLGGPSSETARRGLAQLAPQMVGRSRESAWTPDNRPGIETNARR